VGLQVCSIYTSIIWPLQQAGVTHIHIFVHTYHMDGAPSLNHTGRFVDRASRGDEEVWRLLPHVVAVAVHDQSAALAALGDVRKRFSGGHADPWHNNWYSLRNYMLALNSMHGVRPRPPPQCICLLRIARTELTLSATRLYPVPRDTASPRKWGRCASFKRHSLSPRAKP
jgi:hypothetical protein